MADDDSSELSSVLSEPPSDDESDIQLEEQHGILKFFHKVDKNAVLAPKEATPPRARREPSPPHEYVLADNPDIAVRFLRPLSRPGVPQTRIVALALAMTPQAHAQNPVSPDAHD